MRQPLRAATLAERHAGNQKVVGGTRHPRISQDKVPGLKVAATKVNAAMDTIIDKYPGIVDICCNALGSAGKGQVPNNAAIEELRADMHVRLGRSPHALQFDERVTTELMPQLFEDWRHAANDPEKDVTQWLAGGAPSGVENHPVPRGIFALVDPKIKDPRPVVSYAE